MTNKGRGQLLALSFLLVSILLVGLFYFSLKQISALSIGAIFLLLQQFVIMPSLHKNYCALNYVSHPTWRSYVPILNELDIYTPFYSKVVAILSSITILSASFLLWPVIGFDPLYSLLNLFGADESTLMSLSFYVMVCSITLYVITTAFRGLGFATIAAVVDKEMKEFFDAKLALGLVLLRLVCLMFIPGVRTILLSKISNNLNNLVVVHKINKLQDKTFVEG